MDLLYCVGIGYLFGNFITAEFVGRIFYHKSLFEHGSGNPGMNNTSKVLGKKAAAIVLLGDIFKTILAVLVCRWLFPAQGNLANLYAGAGTMLGHCFPFWHHFEGGKGVAVLCAAYILYAPVYGIIALACGGITLLLKKGVKVAAAIIPAVFCILIAIFQFSWQSLIPSILMGSLEAYLNLKPNKLVDGQINEAARSKKKSSLPMKSLPVSSVQSSAVDSKTQPTADSVSNPATVSSQNQKQKQLAH